LTAERIRHLEVSHHRERGHSGGERGLRDPRLNPTARDILETPAARPPAVFI
jgi:hypothetical protein